MKSFLCRFLFAAFVAGVIAFCNQYGIGNFPPQTPMSKDEVLFTVPCIIFILVCLSYFLDPVNNDLLKNFSKGLKFPMIGEVCQSNLYKSHNLREVLAIVCSDSRWRTTGRAEGFRRLAGSRTLVRRTGKRNS